MGDVSRCNQLFLFNPVQQNRDGNSAKWTLISFTYSWFYGPTERDFGLKSSGAALVPHFPAPICAGLFVVCKPGWPTRTSTKLCLMMVSAISAQDFSFLSHGRFFLSFFCTLCRSGLRCQWEICGFGFNFGSEGTKSRRLQSSYPP